MIIAITGGIGAGKSMVINTVKALGGYTIDVDIVNRELMNKPSYIAKIREAFPDAVVNNVIDRAKLSDIVFSDQKQLIKLNSLAHPLIIGIVMYEASQVKSQPVFVEIALLMETNMSGFFDRIWYIESDKELRVKRATNRSNISEEQVRRIMRAQAGEEAAKALATDIIINNGSEEQLWQKVQELYLSLQQSS